MAKVTSSTALPVPAQSVWAVIGGFNALPDWHPAVEKSETKTEDGAKVRTLSLAGGGAIVEKLVSSDHKERTYSYAILSGPLPVANYEASIRVRESDSGIGCTSSSGRANSTLRARRKAMPSLPYAASTKPVSKTSKRCSAAKQERLNLSLLHHDLRRALAAR